MKRIKNALIICGGFIALGLAAVGLFVPLLPTTPLVLLAVWLFGRSSPKYHAWLRGNRIFGKILHDWETRHGLSVADKWRIMTLSVIIIGTSMVLCPNTLGRVVLLLALMIPLGIVIFTKTIR